MRQNPHQWRGHASAVAFAAAVIALCCLAGCADDSPLSPVGTDSPLKSVMKLGDFATDTPKMSGFVVKTRPVAGTQTYIPLASPAPQPTSSVLTPDEVKAETARLNAARKAQQHEAGVKATVDGGM